MRANPSKRFIVGFAIVFYGLLIGVMAVGSRDIFHYAFEGRMFSSRQLNPLVVPPIAMKTDRWFHLIDWRTIPSAYGPLWVYTSSVASLFWPQIWPALVARSAIAERKS